MPGGRHPVVVRERRGNSRYAPTSPRFRRNQGRSPALMMASIDIPLPVKQDDWTPICTPLKVMPCAAQTRPKGIASSPIAPNSLRVYIGSFPSVHSSQNCRSGANPASVEHYSSRCSVLDVEYRVKICPTTARGRRIESAPTFHEYMSGAQIVWIYPYNSAQRACQPQRSPVRDATKRSPVPCIARIRSARAGTQPHGAREGGASAAGAT